MGPITRVIGNGIGLASEYHANRQASKSPLRPASDVPPQEEGDDSDGSTDHDEDNWELDRVQREVVPDALSGEDGRDVDEVLKAFFEKHPPPPEYSEFGRLPCPVILPQRRPQMNTRGFVRAYAPVLQDCNIDQATWMDFLNGFHKAIKMSPYFHVTNAAIAAGAITLQAVAGPSIIVHLATLAIHTSIEASRRGYTRYQTNKYIDSMNDKLFKPRGLYAMIMTYKPNSTSADEVVDLSHNITQAVGTRYDGHGHKFSQSSGKTGELQLPQAAPIVFPELDALPEGEKESAFKKSGHFLGDYFDRRAQAKFEAENPDSKLNVAPRKEFASRFSDPNHAVYSGGLLAFASGGAIPGKKARRAARRYPAQGDVNGQNATVRPGQRTGLIGTLKKQLKENVLYLMVVNLPSEEEMREVSSTLGTKQ